MARRTGSTTERSTKRESPVRAPARNSPARPRRAPAPASSGILQPADIRAIILDLANSMAPGDVAALLQHERALRTKAAGLDPQRLPLLPAQLALALDCLRDHFEGTCPQIPYYTISLLAGAVYYFADEIDAIPDFLPRIGSLDDAVVMAVAFQLGEAGLRRYCTWKERDLDLLLHIPRK